VTESRRERIRHYVLDGSDTDLRRLLNVAEVQAESARTAICRIGDIAGWRAPVWRPARKSMRSNGPCVRPRPALAAD
jgi:hypothetical protein